MGTPFPAEIVLFYISAEKEEKCRRISHVFQVPSNKANSVQSNKPYRKGKADGTYYRNLTQQNFKAEKRNQVWVEDITYLKTKLGWVYLAAVINLYNREVIGYAVSKKIDTELIKRALGNAIGRSGIADGLVFHGDRGSQYDNNSLLQQGRKHLHRQYCRPNDKQYHAHNPVQRFCGSFISYPRGNPRP